MKKSLLKFTLLPISLMVFAPAYAAEKINLMQQPFTLNTLSADQSNINVIETSRAVDVNQTLHVRIQETYAGYPVWGADGVMHISNAKDNKAAANTYMNGVMYKNIKADLAGTSKIVFTAAQAEKALAVAV